MSISTQRERLRAIVDRNADLFDPPNTAEAFVRLEAALDEAKNHSSADSDITGQNDLLDPPNTAERFARIEAAMDAVFAKSVTTDWAQRHRKKSKVVTRVPLRHIALRSTQVLQSQKTQPLPSATPGASTQPHAQTSSDSNTGANDRLAVGNFQQRGHSEDGAAHGSRHETQRDSDIFRSSVSIHEFADQAYQNAREKYSWLRSQSGHKSFTALESSLGEHIGHDDDLAPGRSGKRASFGSSSNYDA
jgi:hypothetical protein